MRVDRLSQTLLGPPVPGERGVGPLRVWPGGVAVSRSVGDFECGSHVLPVPHIRQVVIPETGGRLLVASDGLWDYFTGKRACRVARSSPLYKVPHRLFKSLMFHTDGVLTDDTTILAVDILPQGHNDFRSLAKQVRKTTRKKLQSWKDLWSFMTLPLQEPEQEPLSLYNDIDVFRYYPRITSRGVAMYRYRRDLCLTYQPNIIHHPVRYDSNAVEMFNEYAYSEDEEGQKSLCDSEKERTKNSERDGRRSPYEPERIRARRITTQRVSQRLVHMLVTGKSSKTSMMFRDDSAQEAIEVDPVGSQEREDIMVTM